ncbi:pyocin knob domain-containing protein [Terribacillus saccharophilus]|uniref:pyocin knob domain-containing protein n=1 Tax=Terribacillus saccharophilus TaxID=361277 RepID=UPI000BA7BC31|nr:pyocin knob domain-containing protein [Terribacillus saccharophilus]PAF18621.1 hypothetical protein CHH51_06900 [Terribacillus saccharophilus]
MAYDAKTDWLPDDEIREDDLNRWEQGIDDAHSELDSHKNDLSNPHRVTKKQVGLGNVVDVEQASKIDFESHRDNVNNPHKVNSTQVNVITAKGAAAKYSEYPKGITIAETGTGTSMGYPWDFIMIETEQLGENRTVQTIYDVSSATVTRSMVRKYREADGGWGEWAKTETEAAAQEKATQALADAKKFTTDEAQMHKLTQDNGDAIPTAARLNDLKTPGLYMNSNSMDSPNGSGYVLVFKNGTQISQVFWHNISSAHFKRHFDPVSGTWQPWDRYETTAGAQAKADAAQSNAVASAQSWVKGFGLAGTGRRLSVGYDLNTLGGNGIYDVQNPANGVTGLTWHKIMQIGSQDSGFITQLAFSMDTGNRNRMFIRESRGGAWGSWSAILIEEAVKALVNATQVHKVTADNGYGISLATGTDLNTMYSTGFYRGNNLVNAPSSGWYFYTIIRQGPTESVQYATNFGTLRTFMRYADAGGSWNAWKEFETTEGSQAKADAIKAYVQQYGLGVAARSGIDWNEVKTSGFYAGSTNGPTSSVAVGMHVQHGSTYALQIAGRNGSYHFRTNENGSWSSWQQIETKADAQEKANAAKQGAIDWVRDYGLGGSATQIRADISTYVNTGFYRFDRNDTTVSGAPAQGSGEHSWMYMEVINHSNEWILQKVWDFNNKNHYTRVKNNGTWNNWKQWEGSLEAQAKANQAASNGANMALSTLADKGIGADNPQHITSLDALTDQGFYYFGGEATGAPRNAGGVVQHMPTTKSGSGQFAVQMAYLDGSRTIMLRNQKSGVWQDWRQIAGNMNEGWRDLTPRGGAQIYSEAAKPQVKREGDTVFIRGALTGINGRKFLALTLPGDCRPPKDTPLLTNISIGANYVARTARWTVTTGGDIVMEYTSDNQFDANWWSVEAVFNMGG